MKLTNDDKVYLLTLGYIEKDFSQIERAANIAKYDVSGKFMTRREAIARLGKHVWLNGVARSAFHWSAVRLDKEGIAIYIDSSKLWEGNSNEKVLRTYGR